jgi:transposase
MAYIEGTVRQQAMLMPERVDEYVEETSVVRFIDAFARALPVEKLGFERSEPAETGRPGYDPRMMLALWIYGYVNRITSSRRLEREAGRNVEVMWLSEGLRPDFKTISDFRKDNKKALVKVFREFVQICRAEGLLGAELVAVDGSKFRAVNSSDRNYTNKKLARQQKELEKRIEKYLREVERQDKRQAADETAKVSKEQLREKIARLRERQKANEALVEELQASGETQISKTDPESRSMKMRGGTNVCYNAQTAVDSKHKLIVAAQVTNEPNDQQQLSSIAVEAKQALGVDTLDVVADRGYSNSVELDRCEQENITTYVPQTHSEKSARAGRFSKEDFEYDAQSNQYRCPAGQSLTHRCDSVQRGRVVQYYWTDACGGCALRRQCMTARSKQRRVTRRQDEQKITEAARRASERSDLMNKRKELSEHPFGTIKRWINGGYFLLKGLEGVRAEFSLAALAYNIKRVAAIRSAAATA